MHERVTGRAFARVGLLGNPSDAYGGKAIALTLPEFSAHAWIEPDAQLVLVGAAPDPIDSLTRLPNVHWLGPCDHTEIPAYGRAFDVALTEKVMKQIAPDDSMFRMIVNMVREKSLWVENL